MYFWVTFFPKYHVFTILSLGTPVKSLFLSLFYPLDVAGTAFLSWYFQFLVSSQLWSSKVPFLEGFFFFSISMIKSHSVVLCLSVSLFLSLSLWIVNHGEREFSPSVPSNVALAPCWDNMANAQTRCPLPKGQACTYTYSKCSADASPSCIYTQYVDIPLTHTHTICPSTLHL